MVRRRDVLGVGQWGNQDRVHGSGSVSVRGTRRGVFGDRRKGFGHEEFELTRRGLNGLPTQSFCTQGPPQRQGHPDPRILNIQIVPGPL